MAIEVPPVLNVDTPGRPRLVRLLNAAGRRLAKDGSTWIKLDAPSLIAAAERSTGLSDWGPDEFRPAASVLLRSLNEESRLNTMGRLMLANGMNRFLVNRLKMQRDWTRHPRILDVPIRKPLFIIGFPRTGSTLLQRLLARDPEARSLQTWEMMQPSPPPEAENYRTDPRIIGANLRLKVLNWSAPDFSMVHEVAAGEPEECVTLLQNTFTTDAFELMANMPGYHDWVIRADMRAPYRYYKKELQLLQWKHEKDHWILKSPFHALGLPAIMELFPDAVVVQTHRDPAKVVPSMCSLYKVMHELTSDYAHPKALGAERLQQLSERNDVIMDLRGKLGDERFMDVAFSDMMSDPMAVVKRIYDRFGYTLRPAAEKAMRDWHASNPQHKLGVHRYTLEEFGLTPAAVSHKLKRYKERYAAYL